MVVENIGGGGGSLGVAAVARARPDGYTLALGGTITHINEVLLKSRPQYDAVKDLDPVAGAAANVLCIAVHLGTHSVDLLDRLALVLPRPLDRPMGVGRSERIHHVSQRMSDRDSNSRYRRSAFLLVI